MNMVHTKRVLGDVSIEGFGRYADGFRQLAEGETSSHSCPSQLVFVYHIITSFVNCWDLCKLL